MFVGHGAGLRRHVRTAAYRRTLAKSLFPFVLATASHGVATYANNKLWDSRDGADFQESLHMVDRVSCWLAACGKAHGIGARRLASCEQG